MKNFFAVFFLLLIAGYGFLLLGGELGLVLYAVAVAAVLIAGLISLLIRMEELDKKLDALTGTAAEKPGAPLESEPPEGPRAPGIDGGQP